MPLDKTKSSSEKPLPPRKPACEHPRAPGAPPGLIPPRAQRGSQIPVAPRPPIHPAPTTEYCPVASHEPGPQGILIVQLKGETKGLKDLGGLDELLRNPWGAGNAEQTRLGQMSPSPVLCSRVTLLSPTTCSRGNEDTQYSGEVELNYGKTKAMAEKIVLEANGKKLNDGGTLRTCILRANTVYGEKAAFLQELYLLARARNGVLNYLEPENTERNLTYVGNVAWIHVLAARNLQLQPDLLAGQVYYCYDDTPSRKGFLIRHQLLSSADPSVRLGSHIPYWKMWLMIQLHRIIRVILSPFWRPRPFLTVPLLNTIVTTFSFETDKASRHFGYKPLFTWQESRLRTAQWLKAAAGSLGPPQLHEKRN